MRSLNSTLTFVILMAAPIALTGRSPDTLTVAACTICFLLCLVTENDKSRLPHYFFLVFLYLALYPFHVQYLSDVQIAAVGQGASTMALPSFAAITLFLSSFGIGALATSKQHTPMPLPASAIRYYLDKGLHFPFLFLFLLCTVAIVLLDPAAFFSPRIVLHQEEARSNLLVFLVGVIRTAPSWFAFFVVWRAVTKGQSVLKPRYLLLVLLVLALNNPVTAPRFLSLTGLFLVAWPYLSMTGRLRTYESWFPVLVWTVLPMTSLMRGGIETVSLSGIQKIAFSSLEFSTIRTLNDWMAGGHDFQMALGHNTLSAVLVLVPRAFWPSKSTGTGTMLAEESGYSFTNVAVPPLTEFFLDFKWLGVLLGGLIMGHLLKRFGKLEMKNFNFHSSLSCTPALLFALTPLLVRGDLSTFFVVFYSFLVSHKVASVLLRIRIGPKRPVDEAADLPAR